MRLVDKWKERLAKKGCKFASLQTVNKVWDLVGVTAEQPNRYTIQYPVVDKKGASQSTRISQQDVLKKDIVRMVYYQ